MSRPGIGHGQEQEESEMGRPGPGCGQWCLMAERGGGSLLCLKFDLISEEWPVAVFS